MPTQVSGQRLSWQQLYSYLTSPTTQGRCYSFSRCTIYGTPEEFPRLMNGYQQYRASRTGLTAETWDHGSCEFASGRFENCVFESWLPGITLCSCTFTGCKFAKAEGVKFNSCTLTRCTGRLASGEPAMCRCTLMYCALQRIRNMTFSGCDFSGSTVANCHNLTYAGCYPEPIAARRREQPAYVSRCITVEEGTRSRTRLVGLELEFNQDPYSRDYDGDINCSEPGAVALWKSQGEHDIHEDGSCGWEAVTRPLKKADIEPEVTKLCEALKEDENTCNSRCGIHVHVDARDIRWADMFRLLRVYSHVETCLYMLAGQHRWNNEYCAHIGKAFAAALKSTDRKGLVIAAAMGHGTNGAFNRGDNKYCRDALRNERHKKHGSRYRGLNLWPWIAGRPNKARDTTVEFRLHRNSMNAKRVVGWMHLCRDLVDYAVDHTDAEVEAAIAKYKSPLQFLAKEVSPEQAKWILWRTKAWRKALKMRSRRHARKFSALKHWEHAPHGALLASSSERSYWLTSAEEPPQEEDSYEYTAQAAE